MRSTLAPRRARPLLLLFVAALQGCTDRIAFRAEPENTPDGAYSPIRKLYDKHEYRVPMRDGTLLYTAVFTPRYTDRPAPILLKRTPYGCRPYGESSYPEFLGPILDYADDGYIFVYQDVRGRFQSQGTFVNVRPHVAAKSGRGDIDESTDTYDTIEWLLDNVPGHNGRVGLWGISYPGFYAAAGAIDSHPALKAVSPQAPVADWWFDDFHHHGAFFLAHAFNFMAIFDQPRNGPTKERAPDFDHGTPDGYQFFQDLGPVRNANRRHFGDDLKFWNAMLDHPNYDEFWQSRNILPHLKNIKAAIMTVGGWFDAEDLYGTFATYRAIENQNPGIFNVLVVGPWRHGGWVRDEGDRLGNICFEEKTSEHYIRRVEKEFFAAILKHDRKPSLPEALVFETGRNEWRRFDAWPPTDATDGSLFLHDLRSLTFDPPTVDAQRFDEYLSDPDHPVPYTEEITTGMAREYMTDDQRFAARRPDVLTFSTTPLSQPITMVGPLSAELWVSTTGTDSDWIVKLIDVFPPDAEEDKDMARTRPLGGYQMMVRSEVLRGRFRDDPSRPAPFVPNEPTRIAIPLQDICHTFARGHRIMIQIQSTWFPLVDRNPQSYVPNIFDAAEADFQQATQRVYHTPQHPSKVTFRTLP